jgi:hypothetical protein
MLRQSRCDFKQTTPTARLKGISWKTFEAFIKINK